ncbi:F0F1 ATP synthase subunit A [uncultured Duncaniella sp.]|uniref:F0F1 ATP synthase subunit A n=1 Tax=uncultured Duncaniella sp. TaxID=2768039 RepID=UPI0025A9B745|nr:F0F1 ATP synthase subunit A [uncultured Duncaniella sp.]
MKRNIFTALLLAVMALVFPLGMAASEETSLDSLVEKDSSVDAQGIIFDHLGDRYGWEVPFNHHKSIPLPVIVWGSDGLHVFSSARVDHGAVYRDGNAEFKVAGKDSPYKGKVVELVNGQEVKPAVDISITKNVCGVFISVLLVIWCILSVARWHKSQGMKGPRKMTGAIELVILFIYDGVIKPTLKNKANKFAPYLLTVFFFILVMNLLGLIVIFPGGANLTGNIAVTLVLAIITFLITNIFATKHYWKEVFNPDVPWWFKWPIPIMPVIEIFGIFTKPAALTVRLFANMMGGHMIVIVLTLLIFIFAAMGPVVTGATAVVSIIFSVFMLLLDVLVSFIQAYVFTMLSTLFIALGQEEGHHEEHGNDGHHDGSKHLQDAKTQSSPSANPA